MTDTRTALQKQSDDLVKQMLATSGLVRVIIDGKVWWVRA